MTRQRRNSKSPILMLAVILVAGLLGPLAAIANSIFTTNCTDFREGKTQFDKNDTICVSGTITTRIHPLDFFPCADIYIVDNRSWSVGDTFSDVMGSPNRLCIENTLGMDNEVIALPPNVKVGKFDLIMDGNENGKLDAGEVVENAGSAPAFEVVDLGHPPVDMSPLKNAAHAIGMGYTDAIQQWNNAMAIMDAASIGLSLMSGDVVGAAIGVVSHYSEVPTDYNGWAIYYATQMIGGYDPKSTPKKANGIYGNLAKHWADLAADPPDADFKVFAPLNTAAVLAELKAQSIAGAYPESYPFLPLGSNPREAALVRVANRGIEQGALVKALRIAYEKYQGAAAVSDYEHAYRQLKLAIEYGELLAANLSEYRSDLANLKGVLVAQGMADKAIDPSGLQALKERMNSTGVTPEEVAALKSVGFSDERIALLVEYTKVLPIPSGTYTLGNSIDTLSAKAGQAIAGIQGANANSAQIMGTLVGFTPHYPTAHAGGPYSGVTGSQITLDGGASTDPDTGDTLSFAWDLDGDAIFDDASGKTVSYIWSKPYSGPIGLKVTDQAGNSAIGYARAQIVPANLPPVITSFLPSQTNPRASLSHPLTFAVTASDPEGAALTYQWTVDGAPAGTGPTLTLAPPENMKGTRQVMVAVRDDQPGNPAAIDGRLVTIYLDCDPGIPATMTSYYLDADGDGFGNPGVSTLACSQPAGHVTNKLDCNDNSGSVGEASQLFYLDGDRDLLGNPGISVKACAAPEGYIGNSQDCNDADAGIGVATQTFYRDADGDGLGNPALPITACSAPAGYVAGNLDCNDGDAAIGKEQQTYYRDADGDGYGDPGNSVVACLAPAGYIDNSLDCQDGNPFVKPGGLEIPHNGKDDDCSASTPDNWSKSFVAGVDDYGWIYYAKSNGDGTFSNYRTLDYLGTYYSRGIAIEDFNGDGHLDFIAGRGDGGMYLFTNDGAENFANRGAVATHPTAYSHAMDIAAGDFNNDGVADFAANGNSNVTAIFLNDGKGSFTRSTITISYTGRGLDAADFNGDGNLDLAMSFYGTNDVWVYRGDGTGKFTGGKVGTATSSANDNYALAAADFDNNGTSDIILSGSSNGDSYLFKGNGDGTFLAGTLVPSLDPDNYHSSMDAYDLNNDGNADIVMGQYAYNNRLYFFAGKGDGTFQPRTAISPGGTRNSLLSSAAPPTLNRAAGFPLADPQPKRQTIQVGADAALTGAYSSDPNGSIASYDWRFADGATGTGATAAHTYASEGRFLPSLTVTDNDGRKTTASAEVIVKGEAPVANAGGPYVMGESTASSGRYTLTLDGSASTDDYGIAQYEWELEDPLSDDFEDGSADGWTPAGGNWSASGGAYQQADANPDRADTLTGDAKLGDYTVEADVMLLSGSGQEGILLFRGLDANNHYEFILRGRGLNDVLLYRQQNGGNSHLAEFDLPFTLQLNTWYHLKAEAYGNKIRLYVDGSLVIDYGSATDFSNGKVGFSTYRTSARFDNLKVSSRVTGAKPTRTYLEGSYNVRLTVTDKAGQKGTAATTVTALKGAPPVAHPGGPYLLDETKASSNNWTVSFDGSASSDDTGIESYAWNFGDGSTGTGAKPSHTYSGAGTRTVTLTVTDRSGQKDTKSTTVTVKGNEFPVANPGGPYTVNEEQVVNKHWSISVDAAASTDDVAIWKYEWNWGDGSAVATSKGASHTYAAPGTYTVTLKVTDHANQSHSASTTASVTATGAPTADAGGPYQGEPNTPVQFDGTASTDNSGILSYAWDFGDGSTGKGRQPQHAYATSGTYTVKLTVKDTALQSATASTTVTVAPGAPPVANAGGPYASNTKVPVRLNGSGSSDDFGINKYEWEIGNGQFLLQESFTGSVLDSARWLFPASGVTQNGAVTLTGGNGWGSRYLFSKNNFDAVGGTILTGQVRQSAAGYLMLGFKNTSTTNYSYEQMPYALYFQNGSIAVYESGTNRGSFGSYANNTTYDVKIELKLSPGGGVSGALYSYKTAGDTVWTVAYDSSYVPGSLTMKPGVSNYSGTFVVDNISLSSGFSFLQGEKPVFLPERAGEFPVRVTVTDGAGQTSSATSSITVSGDPVVMTAPWQFTGGVEVPHDTWTGEEVILKAVAKSGKAPLSYFWDFGDGTSSAPATVTDSYNLSAKHIYIAAEGTPITARVTVTDADGKSASDTFPIIVRSKTLNVEVNKAIDDALWYIHTTQNRANGSWRSSGWSSEYYSSPTASAIHSMEINGHLEIGDFANDPYVEDVWRGMQYVLGTLVPGAIGEQPYGDPDVNGNGIGIQVNSGSPIYEGGQVMMALVAAGTPEMKAGKGGTGIAGRSYRDIVEDMAEMYYWGQGDHDSGYGAGGWRYGWQDQADNSASQWAALGFEAAEEQKWIEVPQWVRDRNIVWLDYSRNWDGKGYGYSSGGDGVATTPSGLAQVAFVGIPTSDPRWKLVENNLAKNWNSWYNGTGNYYGLYALAKAMRTAKPKEVTILGEGTTYALDWYNDPARGVARTIVAQQDANGMFTGGSDTKWVEGPFRTAWGVIILTKTLFVLPPVAVAGENMVWGINWKLTLDGSKSYHLDPFRKISKYEWDVNGDGVFDYSSDKPTASHTYAELGTYQVTLRVTDNNEPAKSATDTMTVIVAVPPHPPIAVPGGPYTGYAGIPLQLDGSASYDIDPTDIITSLEWELDGAYPYNFGDAASAKPYYTWPTPGTYNIGLKVADNGVLSEGNEKLSDTKWSTVTIRPNNAPVANAGGPYTAREGDSIELNGSGSSDPDGNPISYAWDLDDDGTFETLGAKVQFGRPDNGSFTVRLKVSDGGLQATATTSVAVGNAAPAINPLPDRVFNEGGTYSAAGSFTDPGADSWTATVDYGDGTGVQPLVLTGKSFTLNHLYPQSGSYAITVGVTDKDGATGVGSATATVQNVAPVVDAGPNATLEETRSFTSSGSFADPGADGWTAKVNYGDGSGDQALALTPGKGFALSHIYGANGSFTVTVTVTDSDGATGSDTAQVVIVNKAPVVNAGNGAAITEGSGITGTGSFSDPDSTGWSATVDYGDGSGPQPLTLNADKTFNLNHTYPQNGSYTVTVVVTDDGNLKGSATATVAVGNVPPAVNAGADATILEQGTFASSGTFSDPGADSWTATVDYGDGGGDQPLALNPDKSFILSHLYAVKGSYTVTVRVRDEAGGVGSDTALVTVNQVAPQPVRTINNLVARAKPGKADLVWSCVPGNVTYNIYRGTKAGGPYTQIKTGHTSTYCTYADFGLVNGTTYYWRVTSVDAAGESLYSNEATARPLSR